MQRMRKITLYSAISLDGFVARPDGNIDWLNNFPNPEENDFGYAAFIAGVDITIWGNKTYKQIMGMNVPFPYPDKKNYIFTRTPGLAPTEYVTFVSGDIAGFVRELEGHIWLVGGGQINVEMARHQLIDEMILHVIPLALGTGIPLFDGELSPAAGFTLRSVKSYYNGIVELHYTRS